MSVRGKLWEFLSVMLQASQCQPQDESQSSISKFLIQVTIDYDIIEMNVLYKEMRLVTSSSRLLVCEMTELWKVLRDHSLTA